MAGIKDVAKRANVGVGTVSRMLNNSGYVADATRKKIEVAMKELNYTPNELARNLYHKRSAISAVTRTPSSFSASEDLVVNAVALPFESSVFTYSSSPFT